IPFGKQSWYGPLGGIWQSVTLERRSADHIASLQVRPELADGSVMVSLELSRAAGRSLAVALEIRGPDGARVVAAACPVPAGDSAAELRMTVDVPLAWSPEAPHLYSLSATLTEDGALLDAAERAFGFRTVAISDGRILLNGEPIYLRAALDQDYYPDGICTPPSDAFIEDQFRKAKELGLNCLRCHIKVPDPRYYDIADRMGLLIWTELPNAGRLTPRSAARLEATMRGILARDGGHPSIICWTI